MRDNREPWLAATLSMLLPGTGQWYARARAKGLTFFIGAVLLIASMFYGLLAPRGRTMSALIAMTLYVILWVLAIFDAHRAARRSNSPEFEAARRGAKDPWLALFTSLFIPGVGHFYLRRCLLGAGFLAVCVALVAVALRYRFIGDALAEALRLAACISAYSLCPLRREKSLVPACVISSVAIIVGLMCNAFFDGPRGVRSFKVSSASMSSTVVKGDRVLAAMSRGRLPERGDIVVYECKGMDGKLVTYLKRVVAAQGDEVDFANGALLVNGRKVAGVSDVWPATPPFILAGAPTYPLKIPEGAVFVLGDNCEHSYDSRNHGPVPVADVLGRAYKIIWPPAHNRPLP